MAVIFEGRKQVRFFAGPACVYPYPAHMHVAVEIVILRKGYLYMTVQGKSYTLTPNTILTIFPDTVHSYDSASEDANGLCVAFTPEMFEEFYGLFRSRVPVSPLLDMADCGEDIHTAVDKIEAYWGYEGGHPLMLAYTHLLLACIFMHMKTVPLDEAVHSDRMYEVMLYIQQHYTEDLTLDSVAQHFGIGRTTVSQMFSSVLHLNFRKFLNTLRVEQSCLLLQDPELSIKEICYKCGFDNTRTFHRAFQEEQKMTPGEYRERTRKGWVTVDWSSDKA